ncbi:transcriptional regulator [Psychromonas marina]|uniref:Transcriptional regulator n=1 Tax=Psychromonas marina TaxID=88364 RepID=A0ABQ6E3I1_9GAMM|nr:substrate-binding domain-containing protein [Psychromonas marina]GLS91763.1 transcriptional regulator [Psychromonas marina]
MPQNKKPKRPTLQNIADRIGITKMTVSRYMRDPESVSETTRKKIAAVSEELGYIQNRAPIMLSKSSSKVIGVLLPSLSNHVFSSFTQGIEVVTNAKGYEIIIAHFSYNEEIEERKIAFLLSYQVDGLILTSTRHTKRTLQMIKTAGVPVIEAMEIPEKPIDMAVGLDHAAAAYSAVNAMIEKGLKKIAYFGARLDYRTQLRMQGYDTAIDEAGLEKLHILTHKHTSFTLGNELLSRALSECPKLDGVFCTNDDIAIGTILSCKERGIKVPEQLSIIGYNALDIGRAITPQLTSVSTPRYQIGEKSAELLLSSIEGDREERNIYDLGFTITPGGTL